MKKLWILLVTLAMLASAPLFASDVTVGGEFLNSMNGNFSDPAAGSWSKAELNITAVVDDFNTVKLELDSEGGDWATRVDVDDFRLISEVGAALGLPVDVTATFGYFDNKFTGWSYYEDSGWAFYYDWPNLLALPGTAAGGDNPDANGAMQLDIGMGPATLHWYNDFEAQDFAVGVDAAFSGLTAWLTYVSTFQAIGDGVFGLEAAYNLAMDALEANLGAFFRYDVGNEIYTYGFNAGADVSMFHVGAGLEGDDVDALDNIVAEVKVMPLDALTLMVAAFMDMAAADSFVGVDINAKYMVGALALQLGYVIDADDNAGTTIPIYGDNPAFNDGMYLVVDIDY